MSSFFSLHTGFLVLTIGVLEYKGQLDVIHVVQVLIQYYSDGVDFRDSPSSHSTSSYSSPRPEPTQEVTRLLLFSIFAIAARFIEEDDLPQDDRMWDAGCNYLDSARSVLSSSSYLLCITSL